MEATYNNPLFTLTVAEMVNLIREIIKEELRSINPAQEESAEYLTRIEACSMLHISLPTLSRYSKLGIITARKIGNRILFLKSDVEKALIDVSARKGERL